MQSSRADNRQYITVATEPRAADPPAPLLQEVPAEISGGEESRGCTAGIDVLLVDDHALIREGLCQLFTLEKDIHVVGEAGDGFEALQKIRLLRPSVVLVDIHLPVMDGITLTRQITQEFPSIAVIMLTMYQQRQQALRALKNGARGYLSKSASAREVAETIRMVHAQGVAMKPELTQVILNEYRRLSNAVASVSVIDLLAEKEIELVRYVAAGMSNKEIAEKLSYSEKTVKNYLSIIFQKLHLRDRTQVAIFALRHGLLPDEDISMLTPPTSPSPHV